MRHRWHDQQVFDYHKIKMYLITKRSNIDISEQILIRPHKHNDTFKSSEEPHEALSDTTTSVRREL